MANIPLHFSATVVDGLGTEASTVSYLLVPDTATLAQLATAIGTWATDVDAVTAGAITKLGIRVTPALPGGLKAATGATWAASRVEQTGVLNLSNTVSAHRFGQAIPAIADSVLVAGKIDLTNAAITALISLLTAAVAGGTYTNNAQQSLLALVDALISFRKRRKQLSRTSFEV